MRISPKISIYLIRSILPYFVFAWLLLSVILFVQQAGRFSDIFFGIDIPGYLAWQLSAALIPNVIAFTCPMAILVGVIIGLSKMQGDSELIAIRAAGVGNFQINLPIALLGVFLSIFAFLINIYGVPFAASIVRTAGIKAAIHKLESPIEPGAFNTEIRGYTFYVKEGDIATGKWKNVFIHAEDPQTGEVRLITSSAGRIDFNEESSELVLENALSTTLKLNETTSSVVSERIGELRFAIKTRRAELIERLSTTEITIEEMGLGELLRHAAVLQGTERTEARILWQRRMLLSTTPLIFCFLGTALVLRFSRGGRGFGIFLALVSLVSFYLLAFLGEQMARTERVSVLAGVLLPLLAAIAAIVWLYFGAGSRRGANISDRLLGPLNRLFRRPEKGSLRAGNLFIDLTTGLRDFDIVINITKYYVLTLSFLSAIFVLFTAFELWKFAGAMPGGIFLLLRYLVYLTPYMYVELAPSAVMVAVLATYVIKARQNEIVTWLSSGQSIYRLLFPCLVLMLFLGLVNWQVQERIAPAANLVQEHLRDRIRSRGSIAKISGRQWVATDHRIYSFTINNAASDNGSAVPPSSDEGMQISDVSVFEFDPGWTRLQTVYRIPRATWHHDKIEFDVDSKRLAVGEGQMVETIVGGGKLLEESGPLFGSRKNPNQLSSTQARELAERTDALAERRRFLMAVERKHTALLLPIVIALFTAPFALTLDRRGKVVTVGYAVALWLIFMGVTSVFTQLGLNGLLPPFAAVWSPLIIFALGGIVLLSRTRT